MPPTRGQMDDRARARGRVEALNVRLVDEVVVAAARDEHAAIALALEPSDDGLSEETGATGYEDWIVHAKPRHSSSLASNRRLLARFQQSGDLARPTSPRPPAR